jgi:hypothetical protein
VLGRQFLWPAWEWNDHELADASHCDLVTVTGDKFTIVVDSKSAQSSSTTPASFTLNITKQ